MSSVTRDLLLKLHEQFEEEGDDNRTRSASCVTSVTELEEIERFLGDGNRRSSCGADRRSSCKVSDSLNAPRSQRPDSANDESAPPGVGAALWGCTRQLGRFYDAHTQLMFHPLSRLRIGWDLLMAVLSFWSLWEVPLRHAFAPQAAFSFTPASPVLNTAAVIVFAFQPFVALHTIVIVRGTPEYRASMVLSKYVQSLVFPLDFISASVMLLELAWMPLGLLALLRCFYVVAMFSKMEKATRASPTFMRTLRLLLYTAVSWHWITCLWCARARADPSAWSWVDQYRESRLAMGDPDVDTLADSTAEMSDVRVYLWAFYFTVDTASTRGSGDIGPTSDVEILLLLTVVILSTLLYSAIIAHVSSILLATDSTWHAHNRKLGKIKAFMQHRKMPYWLRQRVQMFMDYSWTTLKGLDEKEIMAELPATLYRQFLVASRRLVAEVPIFKSASADLLAAVMGALSPYVYAPQDMIVRAGAYGDEMFIIDHGVVAVLNLDDVTPFRYLHDGSYFGELALLFGGHRNRSVMSVTHAHVYSLSQQALETVISECPDAADTLIASIRESYSSNDLKDLLLSHNMWK